MDIANNKEFPIEVGGWVCVCVVTRCAWKTGDVEDEQAMISEYQIHVDRGLAATEENNRKTKKKRKHFTNKKQTNCTLLSDILLTVVVCCSA